MHSIWIRNKHRRDHHCRGGGAVLKLKPMQLPKLQPLQTLQLMQLPKL